MGIFEAYKNYRNGLPLDESLSDAAHFGSFVANSDFSYRELFSELKSLIKGEVPRDRREAEEKVQQLLPQLDQIKDLPVPKSKEEAEQLELSIADVNKTLAVLKFVLKLVESVDALGFGIKKMFKVAGYATPATLIDFLKSSKDYIIKIDKEMDEEQKKEIAKAFLSQLGNVSKIVPGIFLTGVTVYPMIVLAMVYDSPLLAGLLTLNKILYWTTYYSLLAAGKLEQTAEEQSEQTEEKPKGFFGRMQDRLTNNKLTRWTKEKLGPSAGVAAKQVAKAAPYVLPDRYAKVMLGKKQEESTIPELYDSTVAAFPNTGKRQHSTQPVVIKNIDWIPYLGMKTLYIKGLAQNEGKEYTPTVLFRNVNYTENGVTLTASDGLIYDFAPISLDKNEVNIRCNCPDFHWRFNYFDHLDRSLYGRKRAKYESKNERGPVNPKESPGMCKHCMKLIEALQESGIFGE